MGSARLETSSVEYASASELGPRRRLALVLWNGSIGGAEVLGVVLAERMSRLGAEVTIVFIGQSEPLASRLADAGVPYRSLSFGRGRDVLRYPRRYAREVSRAGPDGALVSECGFMGAALRVGGYSGPIIAVEHGMLNLLAEFSRSRRLLYRIARVGGACAVNTEVAVSDFMLEQMRRYSHAGRIRRIYNGIDPDMYLPSVGVPTDGSPDLVVGFAGRLVPGKGVEHLLLALARMSDHISARLLIAGDGSERARLESLAHSSGIEHMVEFLGLTHNMPAFWQMCDVAVVPSESKEAFPMTTLEAMASGKPVIATRIGGIPELVVSWETGVLVPPGDTGALAEALMLYADNRDLMISHGASGQARVVEHFHISDCARAYLDLFTELSTKPCAHTERRTGVGRQ